MEHHNVNQIVTHAH